MFMIDQMKGLETQLTRVVAGAAKSEAGVARLKAQLKLDEAVCEAAEAFAAMPTRVVHPDDGHEVEEFANLRRAVEARRQGAKP